jgi:hypothetical protein
MNRMKGGRRRYAGAVDEVLQPDRAANSQGHADPEPQQTIVIKVSAEHAN